MHRNFGKAGKQGMAAGYVLIALAIFAGDLRIKNRIEETGTEKGEHRGPIWIRKYHNKGAMLNLGQNRSRMVAAASLALSLVLTVVFVFSLGHRGSRTLRTGLAFLLGGAFSNTYDRLKRRYVVDYFSFRVKWEPLRKVVFNLSDFCIMIGALLTVLGSP